VTRVAIVGTGFWSAGSTSAEKPIATTVAAGERMREACAGAGVTLLVGHELRRLGAARRGEGSRRERRARPPSLLAEANFSLTSPVKPGTWKEGRVTLDAPEAD